MVMGFLNSLRNKVGFNEKAATKTYISKLAAKKVSEFLDDDLGMEVVFNIILERKPLSSLVSPEIYARYRATASRLSWVNDVFTDKDILDLLPEWVIEAVNIGGQDAQTWLYDQIPYIRSFFIMEEPNAREHTPKNRRPELGTGVQTPTKRFVPQPREQEEGAAGPKGSAA